jgi:hypothetical protein
MKFKTGDDTDSALAAALKHEFMRCDDAFNDFATSAKAMIALGEDRRIAFKTYNAYLLSLWARDRLAERETVSWAIGALMKIRGNIGTESVPLFVFLHSYVERSELQDSLKLLWLLFKKVAQESVYQEDVRSIYDLKAKFARGHIHSEDIDQLVACLRPRLKAKEPSRWAETRGASNDNPVEWVRWDFEIALHSSYLSGSRPSRSQLASLSIDLLSRMLVVGTSALKDALSLARQIGWLGEDRDLPNLSVHRVFVSKTDSETTESADDQDNYDSDDHNDSFVPIVRLLSETFEALVEKDAAAANAVVESWRSENSGIFRRLFAVASWNSDVEAGESVAFTANCSSLGLRSRSRASLSTWSSAVDRRAKAGGPFCETTRQTLPPWTFSWSRPSASSCYMASSSYGLIAEISSGST